MSVLRDKIAQAQDIESEDVFVPQWDVKIRVQGLSGAARARFVRAFRLDDGTIDHLAMYPAMLIECCFDPETGEQVFFENDAVLINSKSAAAIEVIAKVAQRLSGMSEEAEKEAGND